MSDQDHSQDKPPEVQVQPKYIAYIKAKQRKARDKGEPVSDFAGYDPDLPIGDPIEYGTKVEGQGYKEYPRERSQSDPGFAQFHPEERIITRHPVGIENVYGTHYGMPVYGPAEWQQFYTDYKDIGQRLQVIPPSDQPLNQEELEFCQDLGIHFMNKLGSGTFGAVYRCEWHKKFKEVKDGKVTKVIIEVYTYACKVIDLSEFRGKSTLHDAVRRMQFEADLTKELDHPNIVKVEHMYNIHDPDTGFPFLRTLLFMPLCDGDLDEIIKTKSNRRLTDDEARAVMRDVCHGLKYLHDRHIVHFDIKPQNILYEDNGQRVFKLTDFGLAKRFLTADTTVSSHPGTEDYKAPELSKRGMASDAKKADIFSLGSTLLKMLVGNYWKNCRQALWPPKNQPNYIPDAETKKNVARQYHLNSNALELIWRMTALEVSRRPTIERVISAKWLTGQPPP